MYNIIVKTIIFLHLPFGFAQIMLLAFNSIGHVKIVIKSVTITVYDHDYDE